MMTTGVALVLGWMTAFRQTARRIRTQATAHSYHAMSHWRSFVLCLAHGPRRWPRQQLDRLCLRPVYRLRLSLRRRPQSRPVQHHPRPRLRRQPRLCLRPMRRVQLSQRRRSRSLQSQHQPRPRLRRQPRPSIRRGGLLRAPHRCQHNRRPKNRRQPRPSSRPLPSPPRSPPLLIHPSAGFFGVAMACKLRPCARSNATCGQ